MSAHERKVAKLIDPSFISYQQALRAADAATASRRTLIECADILESLAHVAPEQVARERYATTFPGGIDDPRQLAAGHILKEPGFLFVGGERAQDSGFRVNGVTPGDGAEPTYAFTQLNR